MILHSTALWFELEIILSMLFSFCGVDQVNKCLNKIILRNMLFCGDRDGGPFNRLVARTVGWQGPLLLMWMNFSPRI